MADLIAVANGNLSSSSSWGLVDTTSKLDSEAANTALTTSDVNSSAFTPGAITIDGFMVKLLNRASSPSGTLTATLRNSTDAVDVASVTINVSDIPADAVTNNSAGWFFFNIGSTTLIAGKAYVIRLRTSSSSQVSAYRDATAGNWSRLLRTTTTQAPAAGDQLIIAGEWTAAATKTDRTITMDSTSLGTSYGAVNICVGGTLEWGTTASTAYKLSLAGNLNLFGGGVHTMGTVGTPMPSSSTAELEFNCASNVQYGIELFGGSFETYGNAITTIALLAVDAAAAATSLTTDISTGWKSGDVIAIAPTTRTPSQAETKALTANASGTSLAITALTNAHGGDSTTRVQAELGNLTHNVMIRGISTSLNAYINIRKSATVSCNYTGIYNLGSATTSKKGITLNSAVATTNGGGVSFNGCAIYDFVVSSARGIEVSATGGTMTGLLSIQDCVFYNINNEMFSSVSNSISCPVEIDNNIFMKNIGANPLVEITSLASPSVFSFTGNYISGGPVAPGSANGALNISSGGGTTGTGLTAAQLANNNVHTNAGNGVCLRATSMCAMDGFISWRNGGSGFVISQAAGRLILSNFVIFGNVTNGMTESNFSYIDVELYGCSFQGGATLTQPTGFATTGQSSSQYLFDSCDFGNVQAHSSVDINLTTQSPVRLTFVDCLLASTTELNNLTGLKPGTRVQLQKKDNTSGSNCTYFFNGRIELDSTIFDTTPSQRLTPNSQSSVNHKLKSAPIRVPVASGDTVTISVLVRTSVSGDGAAYNGSRARLMQKANGAIGVLTDTVIDTATAASDGAFETLTGVTAAATEDGVMEFFVDCDGTAGWINIDTVTAS